MDPNETLRLLRLTIMQMAVDEQPAVWAAHAREVTEYVEKLDQWLNTGGFLPADWEAASEREKNQLYTALRDLVGDHCASHEERQASCPTCYALDLLQERKVSR